MPRPLRRLADARPTARVTVLLLALCCATAVRPRSARAQPTPVVERPTAFDSAGRVLLVTPALATRLGLTAPAWPVRGPFVEARLFTTADSASVAAVLSVTRPGGAIERYALAAADRAALRAAVAAGLTAAGPGLRSDTAVVVSEPAGRAFVRNQTALGLFVYGPAAAVLVGEDAAAALAYTGGAGAAFATSLAVARSQPVTRAQAILSGNMGLGLGAATAGALALTDANSASAYAAAILVGSVAGSVVGFRRAAGMTDAEAAASATAAYLGVAATAGLAGSLDAFNESDTGRPVIGAGIAALAAGYALGPRYARVRAYSVTAGDVQTLVPAGAAGALLGASLGAAVDDRDGGRAAWAGATAGLVTGALLADRVLVRRFDHTSSEADLAQLGTLLGAGVGAAMAGSASAGAASGLLLTGVGALAGFGLAEGLLRPAPDGGVRRLRTSLGPVRRLRLTPANLALAGATAARGGRGTFPLGSLTF